MRGRRHICAVNHGGLPWRREPDSIRIGCPVRMLTTSTDQIILLGMSVHPNAARHLAQSSSAASCSRRVSAGVSRFALATALLLALGPRVHAQRIVSAPGGILTGLVQDSTTMRPVGYALVILVGTGSRTFASEGGRFTLPGVEAGLLTIRAQQIGYRSTTITVQVRTESATSGGPSVIIGLSKQAVVLPEIKVDANADQCAVPDSVASVTEVGSILDEVFRNAERFLTLERAYPYRGTFDKRVVLFDSTYTRTGAASSILRFNSRDIGGYRRGHVLDGPQGSNERWNYLSPADLARAEFRSAHCLWYVGKDSTVDGYRGYLIAFAPTRAVRSVDWAGDLFIDSTTMLLTRSRSHLVNIGERRTSIISAECTVLYRPLAPTLPQEFQATCTTARGKAVPPLMVELWQLRSFDFVKRRPFSNDP